MGVLNLDLVLTFLYVSQFSLSSPKGLGFSLRVSASGWSGSRDATFVSGSPAENTDLEPESQRLQGSRRKRLYSESIVTRGFVGFFLSKEPRSDPFLHKSIPGMTQSNSQCDLESACGEQELTLLKFVHLVRWLLVPDSGGPRMWRS